MAKRGTHFVFTMLWIGLFQFQFTLTAVMIPPILYWMTDFDSEFVERSVETTGTVIKKHTETLSGGGGAHRTQHEVRFLTIEGSEVTFIDQATIAIPAQVGEIVHIRYVPEDPEWAMITLPGHQTTDRTMAWIVLGLFWMISLPLAFLLNRAQLRHFRNYGRDEGALNTSN